MTKDIFLNKMKNVLIEWCENRDKNTHDIGFRREYCTGKTYIRFTTKVIDSILPPSDNDKGSWKNGHYIFYEIENRVNEVTIHCVMSQEEISPRGKEICKSLINMVGEEVKKENWQYKYLKKWQVYKHQEDGKFEKMVKNINIALNDILENDISSFERKLSVTAFNEIKEEDEKLKSVVIGKGMSEKVEYTNYWIFMCNPQKWEIDDFLTDLKNEENSAINSWTIPKWQYDYFKPNQYGVIRVGNDKRTKNELNGKEKLDRGVYVIVKVLSTPKLRDKKIVYDDTYIGNKESTYLKNEYYVEIEYISNLISSPLTFNYLKQFKEINEDKYLISGFQSSTIPLSENAFQKLLELSNTKTDKGSDFTSIESVEKLSDDITETEKEAIIKIRIGQSKIRQQLISKECKCKICGIDEENFLIASHIKPWSKSNNLEKYDLDNLFLLCPHHDALFDKRYISFDDEGTIIISKSISETTKMLMNIHQDIQIKISEGNKIYLEWHRNNMNK